MAADNWKDLQGWTNINILTLPTKPFAEALDAEKK